MNYNGTLCIVSISWFKVIVPFGGSKADLLFLEYFFQRGQYGFELVILFQQIVSSSQENVSWFHMYMYVEATVLSYVLNGMVCWLLETPSYTRTAQNFTYWVLGNLLSLHWHAYCKRNLS